MIKDLIRYIRIVVLHQLYRFCPALSLTDKTVIIVTHDPKIAAFTDRAINMCDGLILDGVSDELTATLQK